MRNAGVVTRSILGRCSVAAGTGVVAASVAPALAAGAVAVVEAAMVAATAAAAEAAAVHESDVVLCHLLFTVTATKNGPPPVRSFVCYYIGGQPSVGYTASSATGP